MNTFISYQGLPLNSGGAHKISTKEGNTIYKSTLSFLDTFTSEINLEYINLTLKKPEGSVKSIYSFLPKLILKFGIPKSYSNGITWSLNRNKIDEALELCVDEHLTISFLWDFKFKNPTTNEIIPHQDKIPLLDFRLKNSRIYLRISNYSTISVWFAFPFDTIEANEKEYIMALQEYLPFKFSNKHWQIWKKSKNSNWVPRKFEMYLFQRS